MGLKWSPQPNRAVGLTLLSLHGVTGLTGRVDRTQDPSVRSTDLRHVFLPLILHRAIPTVRFACTSTQVTTGRTRDRTGRQEYGNLKFEKRIALLS